jgi:hypothetical protein
MGDISWCDKEAPGLDWTDWQNGKLAAGLWRILQAMDSSHLQS